jgi:DNA (cytosine-5)-methyltransferase 1
MKALSLFSGAGGFDIGIRQSGFDVLACIENDPYCCETLKVNVPSTTKVLKVDIRDVNLQQLMSELKLQPNNLDLLFGGPPCQAFSAIGKHQSLNDERGELLFQMVRFANFFQPKVVLIEQVKGLLSAKDKNGIKGGVFQDLLSQLKQLGYETYWQLMRATDFGVAQSRERIFIVATKGIKFDFPEPTHVAIKSANLFSIGLAYYQTVGDCLQNLPPLMPKSAQKIVNHSHIDVTTAGDKRRIKGVPEGSWLASQTNFPPEQLCRLTKKDTTKFRRLSNSEPSLTLRCGEIFFHPTEDRILTPHEYMLLHGYPKGYALKGPIRSRSGRVKYLDQHRQVANSVPPPLAHALGNSVKESLCRASMKSLVIV